MSFETMISPKKNVFPLVLFALRESKVTLLWKKEQIVEATFISHITLDQSVMVAAATVL